jgi:hypothetical protein
MPDFTDLTGLAGVASAMAASVLLLPWVKRLNNRMLALAAAAVFMVALVPFNGFPLAAYVRGAIGDLSITTLVLLWCAIARLWSNTRAGCGPADSAHRTALLALVALGAVALYPMALGWGAFDPYRLGFGNGWFVVVLLLIALAAWFRKNHMGALCVALATLAWASGWYESGNLWDYLLDPFVSIYALSALGKRVMKMLAKTLRSTVRES